MSTRRTDAIDGYSPTDTTPENTRVADHEPSTLDRRDAGPWGFAGKLRNLLRLDGYQNRLTGVGDPSRDKTYGGRWNGPDFHNQFLTGWEAQERWRGSDLGGRIIETVPREMLRKGWKIDIQPNPEDRGRVDAATAPPHTPGPLPTASDDSTALVEALRKEQEHLGLATALELALCYERNYGGGAIFLGVDDGETDLTRPLDPTKVRGLTHLTPFRGGWDGELIAWRYYVDPRDPKFGKPEVYQLRNLGVPISSPPAPGEGIWQSQPLPSGPVGALIFYIHESRFLIFDGDPKSRWAAVQMRGWGDGLWMRVNQVLSQYSQSWEGVAILMQELGTPILKMKDFDKFMSAQDGTGLQVVTNRAVAMQLAMSVARVRMLDTAESLERLPTQLAGVSDLLKEFALRIAAAAGMPVSMLMGQVQSGLGDASKGDISFFDDQIAGLQMKKLTPALQRFVGLQLAATQGVSKGRVPARWTVAPNPQREMTSQEAAKYRLDIANADATMIDKGVVTPEEVASTRFGASVFNDGPIVLDFEGRAAAKTRTTQEPGQQHADADLALRNGRRKTERHVSKGAVFRESDGFLLLGQRKDSGLWDYPGGREEPGENAVACMVRELWEETSLLAKQIAFLGTKTLGSGPAQLLLSAYHIIVGADSEPTPGQDPDHEFSTFAWFDVSHGLPDGIELHHPRDVVGALLRSRSGQGRTDAGEWDPAKHPRGQPQNKGQFGPGGGGEESVKSPADAPQRELVEGDHFRGTEVVYPITEEELHKLAEKMDHPVNRAILGKLPAAVRPRLVLQESIPAPPGQIAYGETDPKTNTITVAASRPLHSHDQGWNPPGQGAVSFSGEGPVGAMAITGTHEVGHAMFNKADKLLPGLQAYIGRIAGDNNARVTVKGQPFGKKPVSTRARANALEYWAESVAAYAWHREKFRKADPYGADMVEKVFEKAGIRV